MGFPVGYAELLLPELLLQVLSVLGFIRKLVNVLFRLVGLPDFLEPDIAWSDHPAPTTLVPEFHIREILPVVKFLDLVNPPESCAVCLHEFQGHDEITRLTNCRHVFHRRCLDRWMGYERNTCPLCRTSFIPDDLQDQFRELMWATSGTLQVYGDYSQVSG